MTTRLALAAALLLTAGCHGASVVSEPPPPVLPAGQRLSVHPFRLSESAVFAGDGSEIEEDNQVNARTLEARFGGIVSAALRRRGIAVTDADAEGEGLALDGVVTRYDRGSWALRVFVGFGAGASMLDTTLTLSRDGEPISTFDVRADSGTSNWVDLETHMQDTAGAIAASLTEH